MFWYIPDETELVKDLELKRGEEQRQGTEQDEQTPPRGRWQTKTAYTRGASCKAVMSCPVIKLQKLCNTKVVQYKSPDGSKLPYGEAKRNHIDEE